MTNMTRKTLSILCGVAAIFMFTACSTKIQDTLTTFEDGLDAGDAAKVGGTLSKDCINYDTYANNNWSGLNALMDTSWNLEGPYDFSDFNITENGDQADVNCTVADSLGTFPSYFKMVQESGFLSKSWKILKWDIVVSGTNNVRIERFKPVP